MSRALKTSLQKIKRFIPLRKFFLLSFVSLFPSHLRDFFFAFVKKNKIDQSVFFQSRQKSEK
jgi:hypothetical protein